MKNSENVDATEENELPKLAFKRLEHALKQIINVGIPIHVQLLKQQIENIEKYKLESKESELRSEQVNAAKSVKLLKADLYELQQLNRQVRDEDAELFQKYIRNATKDVVELLSIFMELYADVLTPFPETDGEIDTPRDFPRLVCNFNEEYAEPDDIEIADEQLQLQGPKLDNSRKKFEFVEFLQKEIVEINNLLKQFSNFVFKQKDSIDTIEANIEHTSQNVHAGTRFLKKASDYKAVTFPIAGAVIGALILGPVGAIAGLKIFGSVACVAGGGILGYGAGVKLKKKQLEINEFEMKALTYPSKSISQSLPDISLAETNKKNC